MTNPMSDDHIEFDEGSDEPEFNSGPFCRHWSDPSDCEEICGNCGHECRQHGSFTCRVEGCECDEFIENSSGESDKQATS